MDIRCRERRARFRARIRAECQGEACAPGLLLGGGLSPIRILTEAINDADEPRTRFRSRESFHGSTKRRD